MKSGNFIEEVGAEIAGILDEDFIYHALDMLGCRRNMSPHPHVFPLLAKASGDGIVNAADEHLMQKQYQVFAQLAVFSFGAFVFRDAG